MSELIESDFMQGAATLETESATLGNENNLTHTSLANEAYLDKKIAELEKAVSELTFQLNIAVKGRIDKLENNITLIEKESRYDNINLFSKLNTCYTNYCNEINCKNRELKESKMMTLNEVEKHYELKYSKNYDTVKYSNGIIINSMDAIAGCRDVSSLAYAFYFSHFKLMSPQLVDGWLVSLNGENEPLVLLDNSYGTKEVFTQTVKEMKCYRNEGGCVWRQDTELDMYQVVKDGSKYCKHSAIKVLLNEGETIIVDWNIGQFQNLSDGNFVFVV